MFIARVIGNVWASVKWPALEGLKLLSVQPYHVADLSAESDEQRGPSPRCRDLVVCADVIGAGVGEDVVVAYGHAARVALEQALGEGLPPSTPVDAAVVAIVDHLEVDVLSD